MNTDGQKCHVCRGKLSKPKPVLDGPQKGKMRIVCMSCGHMSFVAGAPDSGELPAMGGQQRAATPMSGGNSRAGQMTMRNGRWEINA